MPEVVLLALDGLPREVADHAAELCRRHGLSAMPASAAGDAARGYRAVLATLPAGARTIPETALGLSESLGARLVLLSPEPLRRSVTRLLDGAVTVIGVPLSPETFIEAVVRGSAAPLPPSGRGAFETLQRSWWLAWRPGAAGGSRCEIHRSDEGELTAVIQLADDLELRAADVAASLDAAATDNRREAQLWADAGVDAAMIRLTAHADEWLVYWPCHDQALVLWSPHRLPTRWPLHRALALSRRRMLRIPAYPGDLLVAIVGAADAAGAAGAGPAWLSGGPDAAGEFLAAADPERSGLFVEVR